MRSGQHRGRASASRPTVFSSTPAVRPAPAGMGDADDDAARSASSTGRQSATSTPSATPGRGSPAHRRAAGAGGGSAALGCGRRPPPPACRAPGPASGSARPALATSRCAVERHPLGASPQLAPRLRPPCPCAVTPAAGAHAALPGGEQRLDVGGGGPGRTRRDCIIGSCCRYCPAVAFIASRPRRCRRRGHGDRTQVQIARPGRISSGNGQSTRAPRRSPDAAGEPPGVQRLALEARRGSPP